MTITINDCDAVEMLKRYGQQHLLAFWDELSEKERSQLIDDLQQIDFQSFFSDVERSKISAASKMKVVEVDLKPPAPEICSGCTNISQRGLDRYNDIGLRAISRGECCVILMAGGAGTRLGVNYPKGMFDVGLPSKKSLFQIQAERLLRLQNLSKERYGKYSPIIWYIMTSDCTRDATMEYFTKHNYFGLSNNQIIFFEQLTLPVIGLDGKIILESKYRILKSPDGNGGLYRALKNYKIVEDMKGRGIKYVHIYGVDNILIKIADPLFFGYFIEKDVECATKVVEKKIPTETVGVVTNLDGHYRILEYSEIDQETTELRDIYDNSKLMYRHGSICSHMFNIGFLDRVCDEDSLTALVQHIALKKVPYINTVTGMLEIPEDINAIKIEKFVFDVFPLAKSFAIWEAERYHEFSPLKNSPGSKKDCPETSMRDVLSYHNYLVRSNLTDCKNVSKASNIIFEISPLVSYSGEGLVDMDQYVEEATEGSTVLLEPGEGGKIVAKRIENKAV